MSKKSWQLIIRHTLWFCWVHLHFIRPIDISNVFIDWKWLISTKSNKIEINILQLPKFF